MTNSKKLYSLLTLQGLLMNIKDMLNQEVNIWDLCTFKDQ